jgi:hypothetical protein
MPYKLLFLKLSHVVLYVRSNEARAHTYYVCWLEVSIVQCRAISRQRLSKHFPATMDTYAIIEVRLEIIFSTRSVRRSYKEEN